MYSIYPDKAYCRELLRPWKLTSFSIAMSGLLYGALNFNIVDWDVGVTLLMGILTYTLAPWSMYIILNAIRYRPSYWYLHVLIALLAGLFVVDWAYLFYHDIMENQTLRQANFYASTPLYFLVGIFWLYRGSLKELITNIKKLR